MNQPLTNALCATGPRYPMPFANRLRRTGLTLAIAALSFGIHAADTEIYTSPSSSDAVRPNLLLVIDTSNSMLWDVAVTEYVHRPGNPYPPGAKDCGTDRTYVQVGSTTPPTCDSPNYITKSSGANNACAASSLETEGRYTGKLAAVSPSTPSSWVPIDPDFFSFYKEIECEADKGIHGSLSFLSDSHTWPKKGNFNDFPWVTEESEALRWNEITYQSTIYTSDYLNWHYNHRTSTTRSRIDITIEAAKNLIDKAVNVNIGLMRFDAYGNQEVANDRDNEGGAIVHPIVDIDVEANKLALKTKLDSEFVPAIVRKCPPQDLVPPALASDCPPGSEGQPQRGVEPNSVRPLHPVRTPLTETAYEALLYFRGDTAHFGTATAKLSDVAACEDEDDKNIMQQFVTQAEIDAYGGHCMHTRSDPDSLQPGGQTYKSPITSSCGNNYMVMFTDGDADKDDDADTLINQLIAAEPAPYNTCEYRDVVVQVDPITLRTTVEETCLADLARYMYTQDHSLLPGEQNIVSYYIAGFGGVNEGLLEEAAKQGVPGGSVFSVNDPEELDAAFDAILVEVQNDAVGFVAPVFGIDDFDSLRHDNDLYFSMFEPGPLRHWNGNLKKYRLQADEHADSGAIIADTNGNNAINEFGLFAENAKSFWALPDAGPDGAEVSAGGAAHRLFKYPSSSYDASSRSGRVYTYLTDYPPGALEFDGTGIALTPIDKDHSNEIADSEDPNTITRAALGLPGLSPEEFLDRIRWLRGVDVRDQDNDGDSDEGRPVMGGVLHSEPVLVDYGPNDKAIVLTTNDGYLHVFATEAADTDRLERFSIVPKPILKTMDKLYENSPRENNDIDYRLDGTVEIWRHDANNDGTIKADDNDHIYVYFGQRRGGNRLFAFDITDPAAPKLLWEINPANIPPNEAMPFRRLGQTWSTPRHGTILVPNTNGLGLVRKDVILVGGGYDNADDLSGGVRTADSKGNAVYILDAKTGRFIWWASAGAIQSVIPGQTVEPDLDLLDMRYGFPSEIRPVDVQGDGVWESFFAADASGQIWRFDINNQITSVNKNDFELTNRITGGVIADLQVDVGEPPTVANNRRLYNTPDISLAQKSPDDPLQFVLSIGTGYRAHPLNTEIDDRLYVLKYDDVSSRPASYLAVKIHPSDLLDVTNRDFETTPLDALDPSDVDELNTLNTRGWYINIGTSDPTEGEKALSESITIDGSVIFTTYTPPLSEATVCGNNFGTGRVYIVSVFDGSPVIDFDDPTPDSDLTLEDRRIKLRSSGIPPVPKVIYPNLGDRDGKILFGRDLLPIDITDQRATLGYWIQEDAQ